METEFLDIYQIMPLQSNNKLPKKKINEIN